MCFREQDKIKSVMELGGKIRHMKMVPHTEDNDVTLKYFWNYESNITLPKL